MSDRRGIANITDALVFIILVTVVASMLVLPAGGKVVEMDAESMHDHLLTTELRLDRFIPGTYGTMPLYRLLAASIGDADLHAQLMELCERLLEELTPSGLKAYWTIMWDEGTLSIGRDGHDAQAVSVKDIGINGGSSRLTMSLA